MLPIIPHFSSECLNLINENIVQWPKFDELIVEESDVNFVIQINGRKRGIIRTNKEITENALFNIIKKDNKINKNFKNKKIQKSIFVPRKLINFIIKDA